MGSTRGTRRGRPRRRFVVVVGLPPATLHSLPTPSTPPFQPPPWSSSPLLQASATAAQPYDFPLHSVVAVAVLTASTLALLLMMTPATSTDALVRVVAAAVFSATPGTPNVASASAAVAAASATART
ncbi:hypothetical protein Vretifemale_13502 [Volvox reticuliferus]|uniref:Uncharacterized protein n=2 Tax=Volvox reticuliferus TaxID=1737510 RepID=A0A8J4FS84_9CHLO|nr:hypothetical protein Vretifemale_13502 [Volvox reticuliferus]